MSGFWSGLVPILVFLAIFIVIRSLTRGRKRRGPWSWLGGTGAGWGSSSGRSWGGSSGSSGGGFSGGGGSFGGGGSSGSW